MKLRLPSVCPHKPSSKQAAFLLYDGLEALYGGAAGGGKTDALLMAALQYIDVPNYAALILRRSYTDLALPGAIMDRAHEWLKTSDAHWNRETHTYTFNTGATLSFGYISTSSDKYRYQSAEFQFIGWDEVTEFPMEEDYTFMFSRLRRIGEMTDVPLRMRCASNPIGVGTYWVRDRFVEKPEGDRIFIPATFHDNPHLDRESYYKSLEQMHPSIREKLISGDWDLVTDAAFPEFDENIHVIDPFYIPENWRRWEGMDFGVTNPTAWLAAALSPDADTIIHGEYYSAGLIRDHASRILTLRNFSWRNPSFAVCDPSIRNRTGFGSQGMGETVHTEFSKHGLYLTPANNDRMAGRVRISELLRPDPEREFPHWHPLAGQLGAPRLYFFRDCGNVIEQVRFAPIDAVEGETVDPFWESRRGHALAALRYTLTARVYPQEVSFAPQEGRVIGRGQWKTWKDWSEVG